MWFEQSDMKLRLGLSVYLAVRQAKICCGKTMWHFIYQCRVGIVAWHDAGAGDETMRTAWQQTNYVSRKIAIQ